MKKVLVWRKSRKGFFYLLVCGALYGFALQIKSFPVTNHPPDNDVEYRIHEIRRATIPPTNTSHTNNGSDLAVVQQVTGLAKPKLAVFDEELFSDCLGSGYIDSSAYPLIDAQTIFCGSLARISKHGAMLFGVFSLTFAQNCSTLNIQECDYAIPLPERHFILLRDVTAVNGTLQVQSIGLTKMGFTRVLPLFRRNPSEGFYFLPRELSEQNLVTKMVRLLSDKCSNQSQCHQMYEWTLAVLRTFSKHNLGRKSRDAEEEAFQDLSLIIELLTHILSKDFIDFSETDTELQAEVVIRDPVEETSAADVVLFGLEIVLPHMTSQLLLYPTLCSQYYKLVTFLCEIFPEKVETLPQQMLQAFVHSLQMGLSSYGNDNCKLCLEAVESLAIQCIKTKEKPSELHVATLSFVRMVFDTLVVHSADLELLRSAGDAFYSLLCFHPEHAMMVFTQIIQGQADPAYKERLAASFRALVPDVTQLVSDRPHRTKFLKTLETVIFDIGGILCVK